MIIIYNGPSFKEPLDVEFLNELLNYLTHGNNKLRFSEAYKIIQEATKLFETEPILLSILISIHLSHYYSL
jgi:hypothetical protein